jgi:hypothetical protein
MTPPIVQKNRIVINKYRLKSTSIFDEMAQNKITKGRKITRRNCGVANEGIGFTKIENSQTHKKMRKLGRIWSLLLDMISSKNNT